MNYKKDMVDWCTNWFFFVNRYISSVDIINYDNFTKILKITEVCIFPYLEQFHMIVSVCYDLMVGSMLNMIYLLTIL